MFKNHSWASKESFLLILGNMCVTHFVDTCSFSIVEFSLLMNWNLRFMQIVEISLPPVDTDIDVSCQVCLPLTWCRIYFCHQTEGGRVGGTVSCPATVMLPTVPSILVIKISLCLTLCGTLLTQMSSVEPAPKPLYCNLIWMGHSFNSLVACYSLCLAIVNSFIYSIFTFMSFFFF